MALLSRLECLPDELIQHILGLLPDVVSLFSSILTCSRLYQTFIKAENLITSNVVRNLIGIEMLPEAVAAWKSSRLAPWTRDLLLSFVDGQLRSRQPTHSVWTLSDALSLSNFHHSLEYFSLDFVSKSLGRLCEPYAPDIMLSKPPTPSELRRIQRALCRFEIYCNLFRSRKPRLFKIEEQQSLFFSNFSPWENEQLGCIHDYLFHQISPAFNEVTDHDVAWGASGVLDAFDLGSGHIQHVLSLGLTKLYAIVVAESYDERRRKFYEPYPATNLEFLYEGLESSNEPLNGVPLGQSEHNNAEELMSFYPPFKRESDTGPIEAWRWAHQDFATDAFVYAASHKWLRERGYVFWDQSRLDVWPVFQSPWETPDTTAADAERTSYLASVSQWEKCPRRAQIYKLGGRGWWSSNDESKVVYPPGQSPAPQPNRGVGKTSQQAADEFQRRLTLGSDLEERPRWQTWKPRVPVRLEDVRRTPQWDP